VYLKFLYSSAKGRNYRS